MTCIYYRKKKRENKKKRNAQTRNCSVRHASGRGPLWPLRSQPGADLGRWAMAQSSGATIPKLPRHGQRTSNTQTSRCQVSSLSLTVQRRKVSHLHPPSPQNPPHLRQVGIAPGILRHLQIFQGILLGPHGPHQQRHVAARLRVAKVAEGIESGGPGGLAQLFARETWFRAGKMPQLICISEN